jgi:hypothetical protein
MTLVASHLEDLRRSGLSDETIARAGIYSASERQVRDVLGFGAGPGMVIPYLDRGAAIGRNGGTIRAIRVLAAAAGRRNGLRVAFDLVEAAHTA